MSDLVELTKQRLESPSGSRSGSDPIEDLISILVAIPNRIEMFEALLATVRKCFLADHCAILSHHKPTDRWFVEAQQGLDRASVADAIALSWTIISETTSAARSLLIPDARAHELTAQSKSIRIHNVRAVLCAPILDGELRVWGVLYLDNCSLPGVFDGESQRQLEVFARFAGIAIRRCDDLVRLGTPLDVTSRIEPGLDANIFEFPSASMRKVMSLLKRAAEHEVPILLLGETGSGKDVLARWVHDHSRRWDAPFGHINCAALAPTLVESELFGIEKRRATGVDFQEGRLKLADGGTVFLNEIGELPLSVQAKILRVLEDKVLDRVGSSNSVGVDVRFICATHREVPEMVASGAFRRDLYFRMNVFEITVPPLRERPEDIPILADHILDRLCRKHGRAKIKIPKTIQNQFSRMPWKGNIRELANLLERAVILQEGNELSLEPAPSHTPDAVRSQQARMPKRLNLPEAIESYERSIIMDTLRESGWVLRSAAARLGIPYSTLRSKTKKYGIQAPKRIR
jgi:transcriptional regulator with GAF, ATPase, and Fis domain